MISQRTLQDKPRAEIVCKHLADPTAQKCNRMTQETHDQISLEDAISQPSGNDIRLSRAYCLIEEFARRVRECQNPAELGLKNMKVIKGKVRARHADDRVSSSTA